MILIVVFTFFLILSTIFPIIIRIIINGNFHDILFIFIIIFNLFFNKIIDILLTFIG